MNKKLRPVVELLELVAGCAVFAVGFNLFLIPNDLNAGGLSGLAMVLYRVLGFGSVGIYIALMKEFMKSSYSRRRDSTSSRTVTMLFTRPTLEPQNTKPLSRLPFMALMRAEEMQ